MNNLYDLIIIGGGPAGFSAAIYAGRAMLKTLVIEKDGTGGQIGITSEIVNYPGILNISGVDFMLAMKKQITNFGVEYIHADVTNVELDGDYKKVTTANGNFEALSIIIATGAKPRAAGFDGEEQFKGHGVGYCATCDGQFFTGLDIFVIGGGFAAAEEAIFLTRYAKKVHVIVRKPEFSCSQTIVDKVLSNDKIKVHFNTKMIQLEGDSVPSTAHFINTSTNEPWEYHPEEGKTFGTFVFAGYEPLSSLFKGKIKTTEDGYIPTDDNMATTVEGVYAAGDIRPKKLRQLVTAASDGAIAATNAEKYIKEKKLSLNIEIETSDHTKTDTADENSINFFDSTLVDQLKPVLNKFKNNVTIAIMYENNDKLSLEMKSFAKEFAQLTDKVSVEIYKKGESPELEAKVNASMFPFMALLDTDNNYVGIKYHGVPSGHEFNSFILGIYNTAGPGQTLEDDVIAKIQGIQTPVNIKVGISLTCTMCPDVVMACQLIARYNKGVEFQMIDVGQYSDFRTKYNIMSVPAMVINDETISFGKRNMNDILTLLEQNA